MVIKMVIRPTLDDVKKLYSSYKTVPVSTEMPMTQTATDVLKKLKKISSHCYMLESAEDEDETGRYTFLGFDPKAEVSCTDYNVTVIDQFGVKKYHDNPKSYVAKMLEEHKSPRLDYLPTFAGGLVGYFSYDYIKYSEPSLKLDARDDGNFKDVDLMLFDKVIAFDNKEKKIILIVNFQTDDIEQNYSAASKELEIMKNIIENGEAIEPEKAVLKSQFKPLFDGTQYGEMVEKAKHYIREGDIFQVVLSNRLEAEMDGSLMGTYEILRKLNPSPYMFYFSSDDIEIAGASPETLVKLENKTLYTYPLAGTRPRGKTKEEDDALENGLLKDPKELSEHNMLVDLGRNDIGKISKFGTVRVEKYHQILKFSHVMHIGSTVKGEIRDDKSALDAVDAVLPAGTLSGAPKIRAMEIINELENNKRGIYGGAIGYIDFTGNLDTCIAIRIAFKKRGKVYVRSGAGIVADSVPEKEHQECINKAKAVITALEMSGEGQN
ncbi:MAG: anthranilate synthase component I [Clostridiales bacterium]|nr:anthranilate synthase component I [Clostridiales bacterium]